MTKLLRMEIYIWKRYKIKCNLNHHYQLQSEINSFISIQGIYFITCSDISLRVMVIFQYGLREEQTVMLIEGRASHFLNMIIIVSVVIYQYTELISVQSRQGIQGLKRHDSLLSLCTLSFHRRKYKGRGFLIPCCVTF